MAETFMNLPELEEPDMPSEKKMGRRKQSYSTNPDTWVAFDLGEAGADGAASPFSASSVGRSPYLTAPGRKPGSCSPAVAKRKDSEPSPQGSTDPRLPGVGVCREEPAPS